MTSAPDKKDYSWTGALVLWLWEETHIQEVVGLNYGTGYHCKNGNVCLKILKINDKRGRGWPIFLKKNQDYFLLPFAISERQRQGQQY